MLKRFRPESDAKLDAQIADVYVRMREVGVDSEEYEKLMTLLERLHEVKAKDRQPPISRDTLAICLTNLAGIIVIVAYEHAHVVTSKALGQLTRPNTMH